MLSSPCIYIPLPACVSFPSFSTKMRNSVPCSFCESLPRVGKNLLADRGPRKSHQSSCHITNACPHGLLTHCTEKPTKSLLSVRNKYTRHGCFQNRQQFPLLHPNICRIHLYKLCVLQRMPLPAPEKGLTCQRGIPFPPVTGTDRGSNQWPLLGEGRFAGGFWKSALIHWRQRQRRFLFLTQPWSLDMALGTAARRKVTLRMIGKRNGKNLMRKK